MATTPELEQPEVDETAETADVDELDQVDDDPDATDDDELEDQVESPEAAGFTPEQLEERSKKLDKLSAYVARKLTEIFGEDEAKELLLCELCTWTQTHGYRLPVLPPEAVRDAVKLAIGQGTIDELNSYAAFSACETCNGLGNVKTGSHVSGQEWRACPSCKGRGYSSTLDDDQLTHAVTTSVAAAPLVEGGPEVEPDFDSFGTPRSHPEFGMMPQFRKVPISEWAHNVPAGAP
ncbi:MAG TPA: hypothetical protein VGN14_14445 [Candidatus Elarobacter sp.]|jgi:hypothetical protein